jgi:hypothetical protein
VNGEIKATLIRSIFFGAGSFPVDQHSQEPTAANIHHGEVTYSLSPPQEARDEESSLRTSVGEESEG